MTESPIDFHDIDIKSIRSLFKELEAQFEELRRHL
jgi:hypothetical protein